MDWLFYALLAPLFWTFSNYIDKYSLDRYISNTYDFLFFSSLSTWVFLPPLILIFGIPEFVTYSIVPVLLGVALIYSYGFYIKALEVNDTSRLIILFQLVPVVTLIMGFLFLGQTISLQQFIAFCIVLGGALIISVEKTKMRITFTKGTLWILAAILIWSTMFIIADWVLTKIAFETFFVLDTFGSAIAGITLLLIPSMRHKILVGIRAATSKKYGWFTLNTFFDLLGQMCIKKSLALAPAAGLVTIVSQVQSFYGVMAGIVLTLLIPSAIKEEMSLPSLSIKLIGASVMFYGVYLIF